MAKHKRKTTAKNKITGPAREEKKTNYANLTKMLCNK
jgi:hypothetical protein